MSEDFDLVFGTYEEEKERMEAIPSAGTYDLRLTAWKGDVSKGQKTAGTPLLVWTFEIVDCEDPQFEGFRVYHNTLVYPRDEPQSDMFYHAFIHIARDFMDKLEPGAINSENIKENDVPFFDELIGVVVTASCKQDEYQGRKKLVISRFV